MEAPGPLPRSPPERGLAKEGNTLILPANLADVGGMIASAMTIVK
ncbi:band-7 C-terminal domain-containing protein, partial [Streptomyces cinnamoneus]